LPQVKKVKITVENDEEITTSAQASQQGYNSTKQCPVMID